MIVTEPCQFLDWDSQFFGFPIGRVVPCRLDAIALKQIMNWAVARGIRCLYCLCDFDNYDAVRQLEHNGFYLVDIRLTLEMALKEPIQERMAISGVEIRLARSSDMPDLERIAAVSHVDSRFFFDKLFPREKCAELYPRWLLRDANDPTTALFVADLDGQPVGYLSCRLASADTATISLVGLGERARGRGIGKQLLLTAMTYALAQGRLRMNVVTQGRNIAAQRLYQGAGFRTVSLQIWFHRWFEAS